MDDDALLPMDEVHRDPSAAARTLRHISATISISTIVIVYGWIVAGIIAVIFFTSPIITGQKKAFAICILSVCVIGLQIIICIARREPNVLLIFTTIGVFFSSFALGASISFA